jgi:hypothetical protein
MISYPRWDHFAICVWVHSFINGSTAICSALTSSSVLLFLYTAGRTPWTGDQPVAKPLPTQRITQTQNKRTHRHPCLEWNSNPRSQRSSERRQFMPYKDRAATVIGVCVCVCLSRLCVLYTWLTLCLLSLCVCICIPLSLLCIHTQQYNTRRVLCGPCLVKGK